MGIKSIETFGIDKEIRKDTYSDKLKYYLLNQSLYEMTKNLLKFNAFSGNRIILLLVKDRDEGEFGGISGVQFIRFRVLCIIYDNNYHDGFNTYNDLEEDLNRYKCEGYELFDEVYKNMNIN